MSERQGVEIDYCPKCRGVWLDRGELDKIIEHAASAEEQIGSTAAAPSPAPAGQPARPYPPHYDPNDSSHYGYQYYGKPHKRKSFLRELFDF